MMPIIRISTSYRERQNLTMRMGMRRFTPTGPGEPCPSPQVHRRQPAYGFELVEARLPVGAPHRPPRWVATVRDSRPAEQQREPDEQGREVKHRGHRIPGSEEGRDHNR